MIVRTARLSPARLCLDGLDITRQGADPVGVVFAPSWELLGPVIARRRAGQAFDATHWEGYARGYREEMRDSYRTHSAVWQEVLARESVTLQCLCVVTPEAPWCHRMLAAEYLAALGARSTGESPEVNPQLALFGRR